MRKNSKKTEAGVINIRCRPATNYDKKFLDYVNGDQKGGFMGIDQNTDIVLKTRGGSRKLVKGQISTIGKLILTAAEAASPSFSYPNIYTQKQAGLMLESRRYVFVAVFDSVPQIFAHVLILSGI